MTKMGCCLRAHGFITLNLFLHYLLQDVYICIKYYKDCKSNLKTLWRHTFINMVILNVILHYPGYIFAKQLSAVIINLNTLFSKYDIMLDLPRS